MTEAMKRIELGKPPIDSPIINFAEVGEYQPIFVKKDGKLVGMVICAERALSFWCIYIGTRGLDPGINDLFQCLVDGEKEGYTFHVEA